MRADLSTQLLGPDEPVPEALLSLARTLAPQARVVPLWRNELGGVTVRLERDAESPALILKWSPPGREIDLDAERSRLEWVAAHHPVATVVDAGTVSDAQGTATQWMLTEALPGETAVSDRWRASPSTAVRAIGEGLRLLHDTVPVEQCPFEGPGLPRGAQADVLVVAHGDACAPNTLLADDGNFLAHVDLGALGVADRWSDLAVASMSLEWNFGAGWEGDFFDAYGIAPDPKRIAAWRRWWNRPANSEEARRRLEP